MPKNKTDIQNLDYAPFAYAYHKIITNKKGDPVNYVFLDINKTFEKMTGLKRHHVINQKVTDVLPNIAEDDFNWIGIFGNITKKKDKHSFEGYSKTLKKWFRGQVHSVDGEHFSVYFSDVSSEYFIAEASKKMSNFQPGTIDYKLMCRGMQELSGAKYVALNVLNNRDKDFSTVYISGFPTHIKKASQLLVFNIINKNWSADNNKFQKIKGRKTTVFKNLDELCGDVIPSTVTQIITKSFQIGDVVVIQTMKEKEIIGDFTLIFEKNKHIQNQALCEAYADMAGASITRYNFEKEIIQKNIDHLFLNKLSFLLTEETIEKSVSQTLINSITAHTGALFATFSEYNTKLKALEPKFIKIDNSLRSTAIKPYIDKFSNTNYPIDDHELSELLNASWIQENSFNEISLGVIPEKTSKKIAKITGVNKFFTISHNDSDKLYGTTVLGFKESQELPSINLLNQYTNLGTLSLRKHHMEKQLWLSEKKFSKAFFNSPYPMLMTHFSDGAILEVNKAFCDITGYTRQEAIHKTTLNLQIWHNPDDRSEVVKMLNEGKEVKGRLYKYHTKHKKVFHALFSSEIIEIEDKKVLLSSFMDITERIMFEEKLLEKEKEYQTILQTTNDDFFISTLDARIIDANRAFCKSLGYTKEELLQMSIQDIDVNESPDEIKTHIKKIIKKGNDRFQTLLKTKDGTILNYEISATYIKLKEPRLIIFGRDTTAFNKNLIALHNSEQKYRLLAKNSNDVIWTLGLNGRYTYVSPAVKKMQGYTAREMILKMPVETVTKEFRDSYQKAINTILKAGASGNKPSDIRLQLEKICKKGHNIWVEVNLSSMYDEKNNFLGVLGVSRDITDKVGAQKSVENYTQMQELLINISSRFIGSDFTIFDQILKESLEELCLFTGADTAFVYKYEHDKDTATCLHEWFIPGLEIEQSHLHHISCKDLGPIVKAHAKGKSIVINKVSALSNKKPLKELLTAQGIKSTILIPMLDEKSCIGFVGLDSITKHKEYSSKERKLLWIFAQILLSFINRVEANKKIAKQFEIQSILSELSTEFVSSRMHNINDKINIMLKRCGQYFDADRTFVFQFSTDEKFLSNTHEWCAPQITSQKKLLQNYPIYKAPLIKSLLKYKEVVFVEDVELLPECFDKQLLKRKKIQSMLSVPIIKNDQFIGYFGFETIKKKSAIDDSQISLLHVFSNILADAISRTKIEVELIAAKELAQSASRAKSDFLANMSHEIRTPLNGVIGFTELMYDTNLSPLQKQYIENTLVSANSLLGIITDILDYSKIEAGKLELEVIKADIIEVMEEASDIIKIHAAQKGLELMLNIQHDIPRYAYIDPVRLKQILVNLLNNAVKFTNSGEVELILGFESKDKATGQYTVCVRDTGIGISSEKKSMLFKAFAQADTSITRKYGGTGLGLTISNLLAEKMGSQIQFKSQEGEGSKFYFSFETQYEYEEKKTQKTIDNIKNVLIVDDNERNLMILEHTLAKWEMQCKTANSGFKALAMLQKGTSYDLIIMDYHMPKMDGLKTIEKLKKTDRKTFTNTPIILLHSSFDDATIHDEFKRIGVRFTLTKPVKATELFSYLKNINNKDMPPVSNNNVSASQRWQSFKNESLAKHTILLVEDNYVNMTLVSNMLQVALPNATIVEAYNGREALNILQTQTPNLIFMDVQMPIMGGIEATIEIRNSGRKEIKDIPIIALTAGATKVERDNCINAGMNDFITKPIKKEVMKEVLKKYLKATVSTEELQEQKVSVSSESEESLKHFDIENLKSNLGHNQKLIGELITLTLKDYPQYINAVKTSLENKNIDEIKKNSHAIKGSALTIGYKKLGNIAAELRDNADNPDKLDKISKALFDEWAHLQKILSQYKSS